MGNQYFSQMTSQSDQLYTMSNVFFQRGFFLTDSEIGNCELYNYSGHFYIKIQGIII